MKQAIISHIPQTCPWRERLHWFDTIDSTNTYAKKIAKEGAPHGTVIVAGQQTGGRGRMGRSFSSPANMGLYLSVVLRPICAPEELMHLTCAAGLAGMRAVQTLYGICPGIKWANDLVIGTKKLGGILTELGLNPVTGLVDYAIVGIGINCRQKNTDFPEEIRGIATSIQEATGNPCSVEQLTAALIQELYHMDTALISKKAEIMKDYRRNCITLGREIAVTQSDHTFRATAVDVDDDGGLLVKQDDDSVITVNFGEVSIRGMYGYL